MHLNAVESLKSLEQTLNYKNNDVVWRFAEDYNLSENDSEDIFLELKRWLWICARKQVQVEKGEISPFILPLFNEAYVIDLMWHHFLIFTLDYQNFCQDHFGFFIHHLPRPFSERKAWSEKIQTHPEEAKIERREMLEKVYSYLYDELGADILIKWCEVYPQKFPQIYSKINQTA